ncbi:hypothetical protein, partial [Stenotrophomonas maltophilia]|uniref:hypothetical protein n=1 Tax=Stenotrophomonas maltophilia TaxID=40324 RepID=UPI0034E546CC
FWAGFLWGGFGVGCGFCFFFGVIVVFGLAGLGVFFVVFVFFFFWFFFGGVFLGVVCFSFDLVLRLVGFFSVLPHFFLFCGGV